MMKAAIPIIAKSSEAGARVLPHTVSFHNGLIIFKDSMPQHYSTEELKKSERALSV